MTLTVYKTEGRKASPDHKATLNDLSEHELIRKYGEPVAAILLPKQKALKRITQEFMKHSSLVFKDQTSRVDHSFALDTKGGKLYRISVDHTVDAIMKINDFGGQIKATSDSLKTVPVIAIVGYDGFASIRNGKKDGTSKWFAKVEKPLQTTKAGLVLAARNRDSLENLEQQKQIVVASTYYGIYDNFLHDAFGQDHGINLIPKKGGTEGAADLLPDVSVIGDITDTGGSLRENGLNYVLPVSDAAPVIVMHGNWREHTRPEEQNIIEKVMSDLQKASRKAFRNENVFDIRESGHATNTKEVGNRQTIGKTIMTLDEYLASRGKTGKRDDISADNTVSFYGLEPA